MSMTREKMGLIRVAIDAALAEVARQHGLEKLAAGRGTFDPAAGSFSFKVEGLAPGGKSDDALAYEYDAARSGGALPPLGTVIRMGAGEEFKITGRKVRGERITLERVKDGKSFTAVRFQVELAWKATQRAAA